MSEFNQSLYDASIKALQDRGVPVSAAARASLVVATDGVPINRTSEQQKDVNDAFTWMKAKQASEEQSDD